jgi:glycosyltransferase involved in cell wall biosynthesis
VNEDASPKSLHVLSQLSHGGIESWLMNCLRHEGYDRLPIDVCLLSTSVVMGDYEAEFQRLGGRIWRCPRGRNLGSFGRRFRSVLQEARCHIVHSHVHYFSGYILRLAAHAGIPVRIAHSHTDVQRSPNASIARRAYVTLMRRLIARHASQGIACSSAGAVDLFGDNWREDSRWRILFCGVHLTPFAEPVDSTEYRASLGVPADSLVLGHVGRFVPEKNHVFLLRVYDAVRQRMPNARLLLVGDGVLRTEIEAAAQRAGLGAGVIFAGNRSDVAALLKGVVDVFVFPSTYEGLGLALVEAQAAGLPCVASTAIPIEADVCRAQVTRISLDEPATRWSEAVLAAAKQGRDPQAILSVQRSAFNIAESAQRLGELYRSATESSK